MRQFRAQRSGLDHPLAPLAGTSLAMGIGLTMDCLRQPTLRFLGLCLPSDGFDLVSSLRLHCLLAPCMISSMLVANLMIHELYCETAGNRRLVRAAGAAGRSVAMLVCMCLGSLFLARCLPADALGGSRALTVMVVGMLGGMVVSDGICHSTRRLLGHDHV